MRESTDPLLSGLFTNSTMKTISNWSDSVLDGEVDRALTDLFSFILPPPRFSPFFTDDQQTGICEFSSILEDTLWHTSCEQVSNTLPLDDFPDLSTNLNDVLWHASCEDLSKTKPPDARPDSNCTDILQHDKTWDQNVQECTNQLISVSPTPLIPPLEIEAIIKYLLTDYNGPT